MEGGDVETDDEVVVGGAISEWYRAAPEDSLEADISRSKQAPADILGPWRVQIGGKDLLLRY